MTSPREWIATAALCLLATAVLAQTTASAPAGKLQVKDADLLAKFARSPLLLTGKIAGAQMGPAAMSDPPIYSVSLTLENVEMLRGADPKAKAYSYQARQPNPPVFEIGSTVIVAAMDYAGRIVVNQIVPATADALADAKLAACLPAGWAVEGGKLVSPWAELARKDWPQAPSGAKLLCAKTGRPALLAGAAVTLKVEKVIPDKVQQFKNPFGDGEFKLTVTNTSDKAVEVTALLTDGKDVLWADSVVFLESAGKPHVLPTAGAIKEYKPVTLKAGESVSGKVNTLLLKDVTWPRGGSRILFTFCLGEHAVTDFFYYYSDLHDPMREAAAKGGK